MPMRRAPIAALEWREFVIYVFLAAMVARLYFPAGNKAVALLAGFATFCVTVIGLEKGYIRVPCARDRGADVDRRKHSP